MTPEQRIWAEARDGLTGAVAALGYPAEFADVLARQLGSPRAIRRMTAYIERTDPITMEMIADEMLAICGEIDTWREKKASEEAQAGYNAWLNSNLRRRNTE